MSYPECPTAWEEHEDHCYLFIQSTLTLPEAKTECQVSLFYLKKKKKRKFKKSDAVGTLKPRVGMWDIIAKEWD